MEVSQSIRIRICGIRTLARARPFRPMTYSLAPVSKCADKRTPPSCSLDELKNGVVMTHSAGLGFGETSTLIRKTDRVTAENNCKC